MVIISDNQETTEFLKLRALAIQTPLTDDDIYRWVASCTVCVVDVLTKAPADTDVVIFGHFIHCEIHSLNCVCSLRLVRQEILLHIVFSGVVIGTFSVCCVLTQESLPHLPPLRSLKPTYSYFFSYASLQASGEEIGCDEFNWCSSDRGGFFLFCRILSELHVSVQKTLDEDRLQLSRDTINAILSYKKSLETPANRK